MCTHAPIMAGQFGANMASNGSVTSTVISWVTSKKETHKSASHLGHKMSKKSKKCVWMVPSRKKMKKTTNQHTPIPHIGKSGRRYYDVESIIFQLILDIFAAREVVTQALFSSFEFCADVY